MTATFDRARLKAYRALGQNSNHSAALPGFLYSDTTVFNEERDRIFEHAWQWIAHESDLPQPGYFVTGEVAGEPVFVVRQKDGTIGAFYNVCQHRAHQIVRGKGHVRGKLVCPYHAWSYNLDGSLAASRFTKNMPEFDPADFGLSPVRVETALGFVFVNLDDQAPSLQQQYGDMFADMAATLPWLGELVVNADLSSEGDGWEGATLAANWKVLAENCLECYHCGPAHPDLVDLIDMKTYSCTTHGDWLKSYGKIKKPDNSAYHVDPNEPVQEAIFWHMWPNIEFSILPGSKAIGAFRFNPMDAENTAMNSIMLTVPGEGIAPDRLTYRWDVLWPEDKTLCMSVHKGLKSKGYRQGRFVTDPNHLDVSEHAVHYFQQLYARAMEI